MQESRDWLRLFYMTDSTTISLFCNVLKGVGRHHTIMKYLGMSGFRRYWVTGYRLGLLFGE